MNKKTVKFFFLPCLLFIFFPIKAMAQNLPPGEQPGAQASRFQAESEQRAKQAGKKKVQAPQIEVEKEKAPPSEAQGPSFLLLNVKITGSTLFKPDDLRPVYENFIGKKVSFKDLEEIASGIKAMYKKRGYLSTDAYIPEQNIAQGEVEIRVAEGKLGRVLVEGNKWFSADLLKKYIHIKTNQLLNIFKLQKDMVRLNQNPDLEVTAVLAPGTSPETSDIILKVKDSLPYHIGAGVDNFGTRLVGMTRTSGDFRSTNLTGHNDSVSAMAMTSATSNGDFLSYTAPLGTTGTRAGLDYTFFYMKDGKEYLSQDITGTTQIWTPHVSQELSLSEDFQAYADLGMDILSVKQKNGENLVIDDQLRVPYLSFDLTKLDTFGGGGQTVFDPRFSFGTGSFLGASTRGHNLASRPDTGGFFFIYEQVLKRIQRLPLDTYLVARTQFQVASHTLPSSEQFQLGGANSVRGYPEGDYLADDGIVMNLEWYLPCPFVSKEYKLPHATMPFRTQLQPVIFFDLGAGRLLETAPGERKDKFLMGAGLGLRFQFNKNFFFRLDWAEHLGDKPIPGQGPSNFYVSCQIEV